MFLQPFPVIYEMNECFVGYVCWAYLGLWETSALANLCFNIPCKCLDGGIVNENISSPLFITKNISQCVNRKSWFTRKGVSDKKNKRGDHLFTFFCFLRRKTLTIQRILCPTYSPKHTCLCPYFSNRETYPPLHLKKGRGRILEDRICMKKGGTLPHIQVVTAVTI